MASFGVRRVSAALRQSKSAAYTAHSKRLPCNHKAGKIQFPVQLKYFDIVCGAAAQQTFIPA
jgi:hypothetical protein